jgi:hypothetical protein
MQGDEQYMSQIGRMNVRKSTERAVIGNLAEDETLGNYRPSKWVSWNDNKNNNKIITTKIIQVIKTDTYSI